MNDMSRAWQECRIALTSGLIIALLFGAAWAVEEHLARVESDSLAAAVVASRVVALTNDNRTDEGLPALRVSPLLTQAAQLKAEHMAEGSYYAHVSPDGKTPLYWLDTVGYRYLSAGENLVIDRTTSDEVVSAWMNSSDHRENILRPQFTEVGVGVAYGRYKGTDTIYVAQEFGTPYPDVPLARTPKPAPVPVPVVRTEPTRIPQKIALPNLTPKAVPVLATSSIAASANTLVRNVAALAAPVLETIKVRPEPAAPVLVATTTEAVATTTATTTAQTAPPAIHLFEAVELPDILKTPIATVQQSTPYKVGSSWVEAIRSQVEDIRNYASGVPRLWK